MTLRSCLSLFILSLIALAHAHASVQNRWADVVISRRDYSGNLTASDRNAYYANGSTGGTLPAIEYDADPGGTGQVSGVVYTRGTASATIAVTFKNWNSFALSGTLRFISARLTEPDASGNEDATAVALTVSPNSAQNISLGAGGGSQTFTITVSGLPNSVALGHLALNYDLPLHDDENATGNNGTNGGFEPWERLYVVDQAPVGLQAVPWTDFLESSCRWAFGAVGQTDMRQKMTYGMHYNTRSPLHIITYQSGVSRAYVNVVDYRSPNPPLRLKKFVKDLDANDTQYSTHVVMQCEDYAAILNLAFASQGFGGKSTAYYATDSNGALRAIKFLTNPLCPPQYSDTVNGSYSKSEFYYHVVVAGSVDNTDVRFDSSNSYEYEYSAGASWMKPVVAWPFPDFLYGAGGNGHGLIDHFLTTDGSGTITTIDYTSLAISS